MKNRAALIFGYNDYALEIAKNIRDEYENVYLYSLNSEQDILKNRSGFEVKSFWWGLAFSIVLTIVSSVIFSITKTG